MVSGIDGAIGASVLRRDFRLEEGNVKHSLVLGKGYKKENANRQYLRSAKVCCVVHPFFFSLFQALSQESGSLGDEWGLGEKRRERPPADREPATGCLS